MESSALPEVKYASGSVIAERRAALVVSRFSLISRRSWFKPSPC